jgi:hypothetical protein
MTSPSMQIVASYVAAAPAAPAFDPSLLYAISNFSPMNYFRSQVGGGEAGVASGFGVAALVQIRAMPVDNDAILFNLPAAGTAGYRLYFYLGNLYWQVGNGTGLVTTPVATILPSDVGKLFLLLGDLIGGVQRVWARRVPHSSVANATYTPSASNGSDIGNWRHNSSYAADSLGIVGEMTWRGAPSDAQLIELYDAIRVLGDMPTSIAGATITHRWSLKDTLLAANEPVVDGQTAPASLTDSVTLAAVDTMTRQGAPVVRRIETVDGLTTYGAAGFGQTTHLTTAAGANTGIVGHASGFYVQARCILTVGTSGFTFVSRAGTSTSSGYYLDEDGSLVRVRFGDGANLIMSPTIDKTPYIGIPIILTAVWDAPAQRARIFVDGVEKDSGTLMTAYAPNAGASIVMYVGHSGWGTVASTPPERVFQVSGGHIVPSAAVLLAQAQESRAAGVLVPLAAALHLYDITQDIAVAGPDAGIPAQVLDRVGSDHLTRVGGWLVKDGGLISGEAPGVDATTTILRTVGSGFPGSTSPWSASTVWYDRGLALTAPEYMLGQATFGAGLGWTLLSNPANVMRCGVRTTGGTVELTHTLGGNPSVGVHVLDLTYDGSQFKLYYDGVLSASSATGLVFEPAASEPMVISGHRASAPVYAMKTRSALGAVVQNVCWTPAQIATAAAAAIAAGKPVGVPGHLKRWSIKDDIAEAGGKVPAILKERVSNQDHMVVIGAPLQAAERTERLWSYEAAPILYGTAPLDTTNKYIACAGGTSATHQSALWFAMLLVVTSQPALGVQYLGGKRDTGPSTGWGFVSTLNNTQIAPRLSTSANAALAGPIATVAAGDVGKLLLIGGTLDAVSGHLRTYHRRAEVSTGASLSGGTYLPAASSPCVMGGRVASLGGASLDTVSGVRILGMMCGRGIPGLARWQAAFDAAQAREDLIAIPGYTEHLWSLTASVKGNGGVMPATIADQVGTDHMTVYGGLQGEGNFARSWGW